MCHFLVLRKDLVGVISLKLSECQSFIPTGQENKNEIKLIFLAAEKVVYVSMSTLISMYTYMCVNGYLKLVREQD